MDLERRNAIAFLIEQATACGYRPTISGDFAFAAWKRVQAEAEVQEAVEKHYPEIQATFGKETPSKQELSEYINELADAIIKKQSS